MDYDDYDDYDDGVIDDDDDPMVKRPGDVVVVNGESYTLGNLLHSNIFLVRNRPKLLIKLGNVPGEGEMQQLAADLGIAPPVYAYDDDQCIIVMMRCSGPTVSQIEEDEVEISEETEENMNQIEAVDKLMDDMEKCGLVHDDLHSGNIVWDDDTERFYIIDWETGSTSWREFKAANIPRREDAVQTRNYRGAISTLTQLLRNMDNPELVRRVSPGEHGNSDTIRRVAEAEREDYRNFKFYVLVAIVKVRFRWGKEDIDENVNVVNDVVALLRFDANAHDDQFSSDVASYVATCVDAGYVACDRLRERGPAARNRLDIVVSQRVERLALAMLGS